MGRACARAGTPGPHSPRRQLADKKKASAKAGAFYIPGMGGARSTPFAAADDPVEQLEEDVLHVVALGGGAGQNGHAVGLV